MEVSKINFNQKTTVARSDSENTSDDFKSTLKTFMLENKNIEESDKDLNSQSHSLKPEEIDSLEKDLDDLDNITNMLPLISNLNLIPLRDNSLDINASQLKEKLLSEEDNIKVNKSGTYDLENILSIANSAEASNENLEKTMPIGRLVIEDDAINKVTLDDKTDKISKTDKESIKIGKNSFNENNSKDSTLLNTQSLGEEIKNPSKLLEKDSQNTTDSRMQFNEEVKTTKDKVDNMTKLDLQIQKSFDNISTSRFDNNVRSLNSEIKNLESIKNAIIDIQKPKTDGDIASINIRLKPDNLGQLSIDLKVENGDLKAIMMVQSESTKNAILNKIDELSISLMKQNITISKFEVKVVNDSLNFEFAKNQSNFNQNSNASDSNRQNKHYWNKNSNEDIQALKFPQFNDNNVVGVNILA
ncbi:flagellar hook-length control protein FliK [Soehngenia saccharolytica]|nr:flagellar hook-length control protein FliK [Soehngenia saccharolytica]